ncbi:MAG TPA: ZIP family metal transporter [Steroidobacteraceae bacterium]
MPLLGWIISFTALGGIASAAFASVFLLLPQQTSVRLLPHFVSFATGALLGAALLALLPEAMEGVGADGAHRIGVALVVGLGVFFVIEKLVLWRHSHGTNGSRGGHEHGGHVHGHDHGNAHEGHSHQGHTHGDARDRASGVLILVGDSVHNVLDGILIAAAFLTDKPLGLVTTFAVAAHEIPHRLGDFALLVHSGMTQRRALALNMATGLAAVMGGVIAYFGLSRAMGALPYALALAAAGFLYIAVAGLIPALHRRTDARTSFIQVALIALGVGVIAWAESLVH